MSVEVSDSLPMKLSVRGRRIRHKKWRLKLQVFTEPMRPKAKDCKCSVLHSGGEQMLRLDVETLSCHLKFHLKTTSKIYLVGRFAHPRYPYLIKWRMGRMRYKLTFLIGKVVDQSQLTGLKCHQSVATVYQ